MQRFPAFSAIALVITASWVAAQQPAAAPPVSAVATLASSLGEVGGYLTKSAEQMPEADFAFKPTPEVRSFGQIIGHVAGVNYFLCSLALGEKNPGEGIEKAKTAKADLVEAVRASFTYCERAYALSDAEAAKTVTMWGEFKPRLSALTINLTHDWEHYGNVVTYLRLKGKVPPSSQPGP
jgi:uncharacterized damage-inducible protein DinB